MANLLDCPFCGGKPGVAREYDCDTGGRFFSIKCDSCGASSRQKYAGKGDDCPNFYSELAHDWNQRQSAKKPEEAKADSRIADGYMAGFISGIEENGMASFSHARKCAEEYANNLKSDE
jgi:transcription elongation factor Elf1